MHRRPRREVRWQLPPLAAGPEQVEDRIEQGTDLRGSWPAAGLRRREVGQYKRPRFIEQIGWLTAYAHDCPQPSDQGRSYITDTEGAL